MVANFALVHVIPFGVAKYQVSQLRLHVVEHFVSFTHGGIGSMVISVLHLR